MTTIILNSIPFATPIELGELFPTLPETTASVELPDTASTQETRDDFAQAASQIIALRKKAGMTIYKFAEASGVHESTIRNIETRKHFPRRDTLTKIIAVFATSQPPILFPTLPTYSMQLRKLRQMKKMTQQKLQGLSGISHKTISSIELGKSLLFEPVAVKLAAALEVPVDMLYNQSQSSK